MNTQKRGGPRQRRLVRAGLLAVAGLMLIGVATGGRDRLTVVPASIEVVTAARAIPAGAVIVPADVVERAVAADDALRSVERHTGDVVGRRIAIAVTRDALLSAAMFDARPIVGPARTIVSLSVDAHQTRDLSVDDEVEVVAAVADAGSQGNRVVPVVSGRVVAVDRSGDAGGGSRTAAALTVVAIECSGAGAMRALWAEAFARSVAVVPVASAGALPEATTALTGAQ